MAKGTRLHLEIDPEEITLGQLIRLESIASRLIREVGAEVGRVPIEAIKWVVDSVRSGSPITYELRPTASAEEVPAPVLERAVHAITNGLAALAKNNAARPPFFNDEALERARDLGKELGDHVRSVKLFNSQPTLPPGEITKLTVANVEAILAEDSYEALGTVEGRLEAVNVHSRNYFNVYDDLTGARIECQFGADMPAEEIGAAIGKRVGVYGTLVSRETGRVVRVRVAEIEVFPSPEHLPALDDIEGIVRS
jgi:hypothetical protein